MRLAIELMNALAFRRSDVIRVGPPNVIMKHIINDDGSLGLLVPHIRYRQHKNRNVKPIDLEVPIPADVLAIIKVTMPTGIKTWLVNGHGKSFSDQTFTDWFSAEIAKAKMPTRCTPHGLRKRCCTDMADQGKTPHQIMAVSGHLSLNEIERYTRRADQVRNAQAAMAGRV